MAYQQGGGFGGPREMHKAVCAECKKDCEVPFKPREGGKPIFKLINPIWHEIKILRDKDLEGKFLMEGVMPTPENSSHKEPSLVYDKTFCMSREFIIFATINLKYHGKERNKITAITKVCKFKRSCNAFNTTRKSIL